MTSLFILSLRWKKNFIYRKVKCSEEHKKHSMVSIKDYRSCKLQGSITGHFCKVRQTDMQNWNRIRLSSKKCYTGVTQSTLKLGPTLHLKKKNWKKKLEKKIQNKNNRLTLKSTIWNFFLFCQKKKNMVNLII